MEVYVLEVYDQGERIAYLDGDGNWECSDYEKLKEVVKETMAEISNKHARGTLVAAKYTGILLQRQLG